MVKSHKVSIPVKPPGQAGRIRSLTMVVEISEHDANTAGYAELLAACYVVGELKFKRADLGDI